MKKILSMVLVLAMALSLVTVSAGAKDYTDASEITYKEAVDVMSDLGIIDGYTDGSFNPSATLTRGAAAKIICNLILGPTTASALQADTAPFPDVPADHTFAGYIAYCARQGIINGYADGTFGPANGLTGYAFMKMLLGALGYDAAVEGYIGANYSIQVAKQALAIGLDDGNENFNGTRIVNREEALLYAFNTLRATMVEYSQKTEINTGNATVTVSGGRQEVTGSDKVDYNGAKDGKVQFCEKYFPKLTLKDDDTDTFGRWVNTWKNGKTLIGSYVKTPDALYHADVKEKDIYADLDLDEAYTFEIIVDGEEAGTFTVNKKNNAEGNDIDSVADAAEGIVGNGSDIYVYLNDEASEGRIVVINTFLAVAGDDYDEKKETLTLDAIDADGSIAGVNYSGGWDGETLSSEDWAGLDKYADGDYVLLTIASGEVESMKKAEAVTATVTEYVHGESVTADGEEYAYSAASMHREDEGNSYKFELKTDYSLYLDEEGYVLYATGEIAEDKFVYIDEFSSHSTSSRASADAYAFFADGTEAEIKVSHVDGTAVTAGDVTAENTLGGYANGWFTYTEKDGKYKLTFVDEYQTGEKEADPGIDIVNYKKNHTKITDGVNTFYGTTRTNFIVIDEDGDVRVYTGIRNVPDILSAAEGKEATSVNIHHDGTYAKHVFIDLGEGETGSADISGDIIFLLELGSQGNDADDEEYYKYTALVNGEKTTIKVDKKVFEDGEEFVTSNALLYDVEYTGKKYVSDAKVLAETEMTDREDMTAARIEGNFVDHEGNTLELGNASSNDYFMADDYRIFVIEDGEYDTYTVKQLERAVMTTGSFSVDGAWVYGLLNADGEYTALYIVL